MVRCAIVGVDAVERVGVCGPAGGAGASTEVRVHALLLAERHTPAVCTVSYAGEHFVQLASTVLGVALIAHSAISSANSAMV